MKKRKILYISGARADYGLMEQALFEISQHPNLELAIIATAMHLMPKFGRTANQIKKRFKVYQIPAFYEKDKPESMLEFIAELILKLKRKIKAIKPDIILLLGDRPEMLAGAVAGAYLSVPIAHIHGGDVSSTVDEIVRHSITKLCHLHFPATKKSAERIIKMGEEKWRVFTVGAPGLDGILNQKLPTPKQTAKKYHLNLEKPILLVLQHPVSLEWQKAGFQIKQTMQAVKELGYQTIVIYPNADPGSGEIIKVIEKYRGQPSGHIYKSIPRQDYLGIMNIASAMLGNSSSGIIEAPALHLPVVNIGVRQQGRERANNIIDVDYKKQQIKKAIKQALFDEKLKTKVKNCQNPYGNGRAGERIAKTLGQIKIDKKLLNKKLSY